MAMFRHAVKKRARILTPKEFTHVLDVATLTREPERNQVLICLTHSCGLRVSELARVTIRDVMYPSGCLRDELTVRDAIAKFNKARTVPMTNKRLREFLEVYLDYRVKEEIGMIPQPTDEFRGLSPDLPLIFSDRKSGFTMSRKKRRLESGEFETYLACDSLENCFRRVYRKAGLYGASSHSGRRYYASTMLQQGVKLETISLLLGHQHIDHSYPYLEPTMDAIRHAFEIAL